MIANTSTINIFENQNKVYSDETTNFHTEIPEAGLDTILKKDENYYLQVFLEECTYTEKEKKVIRCITDNLRFSSDFDESDED